jgi:hypothetical protein
MRKDKIMLQGQSMEEVWRKWNVFNADGGHLGSTPWRFASCKPTTTMVTCALGWLPAYYYYGDLHAWLAARKLQCLHCQSLVVLTQAKPPPATISSERPYYCG